MKEVTIENIADGVAPELFGHELAKVAANICDQNTKAKAKRQIVLTFTFEPDEEREETRVTVECKSKLATIKPYSKTAFIGKRNGKPTVYAQDERQTDMFDEEQATPISRGQKAAVNNA